MNWILERGKHPENLHTESVIHNDKRRVQHVQVHVNYYNV